MRKSNYLIILVYWMALFLLALPVLKQSVLSYKLIQNTETPSKRAEQPLKKAEPVQPPTFSEVLTFKGTGETLRGKLFIPSLELMVPVYPTATQNTLLAGSGMLFPERSPETDNLVVLGHHLGNQQLLFGQLLDLKKEEDIYFQSSGIVYHYRVQLTKIIKESDLNVLEETDQPQLTLITCDRPTQTDQRFVVIANLQQQEQSNRRTRSVEQRLEQKTQWRYCQNVLIVFISFFSFMIVGTFIIWRQLCEEEKV
ncbi:class A sortase [Enterococcus sp. AZ109]|uniref:class A sortase n=1 Tax=Enterococcus sp. AZ109 TaxID=2774634 RepID=UPI003F1E634F